MRESVATGACSLLTPAPTLLTNKAFAHGLSDSQGVPGKISSAQQGVIYRYHELSPRGSTRFVGDSLRNPIRPFARPVDPATFVPRSLERILLLDFASSRHSFGTIDTYVRFPGSSLTAIRIDRLQTQFCKLIFYARPIK